MMLHVRVPALLVCACFSALSVSAQAARADNFDIVTLTNRADLISGGNAMVEASATTTSPG